MHPPALALSYQSPAQEADFEEALELLRSGGQEVETEEREPSGPFAGLEWLIPTAVIFFIGKAYVDGFVKEIGKDHYNLLKGALKTLWSRMVGPDSPALTVIGTAGKARAANEYSLFFSLLAEAPDGIRFKLLIKSHATQEEYQATIDAFIDFIDAFYKRELTQQFVDEAAKIPAVGKTLLVAYDSVAKRIHPVDPLAGRRK
jgi:hypothetical protein